MEEIELTAVVPTTNGHHPVRRLSALDKLFTATGEVTIKCGTREVTLGIQAVDLEFVESVCRPFRPVPRMSIALVNGKREALPQIHEPDYQDKLAEYNRLNSYAYVLAALLCDIEDEHGQVVWSADNTVHDVQAGRRVLRQMGIVDAQLVAILDATRELTRVVEEEQVGE